MNTKSYQDQMQPADVAQGLLERIMIYALGIVVPLASIFGALNIMFRLPDYFRFEFGRIEVSKLLDLSISDDELGSFFSKFMMHKQDTFSLTSEYEGVSRNLFNQVESGVMEGFRVILDVSVIVCIVCFLITIGIIFVLHFNRMAKELRKGFNIALLIYLILIVGLVVYFNVYSGDVALLKSLMDGKFVGDALLQQMFDGRFTLDTTVVVIVISFIIMMIIRYIVWKLTAQKGVFSEALRGVGK